MAVTLRLLATALVALAMPAIGNAAPADVAAAIASADRPAEDVKLDSSRKPAEVLTFLGLEHGDRALDLMAGGGYYTELLARAVGPNGSVVAHDHPAFANSPEAKKEWDARGPGKRLPNVTRLVTAPGDLALAPASFDFALLHLVYHDAYWESAKYDFPRLDPQALVAKLYAAMKPGGIVGVVDHVAAPGGDARRIVDKLHRIDPAIIRADFERAGFVLDGESDLLRMPDDDKSKLVFDPAVRGKTDRIVYRFKKPTR